MLLLQEQAVRRNLPLLKVDGTSNPADLMTKNLPKDDIDKYMDMMGMEFRGGRAENAPEVYSMRQISRGRKRDFWEGGKRIHLKARPRLFIPLDVISSDAANQTPGRLRITKGLASNGHLFEIRDDWTKLDNAHRQSDFHWIGTTTFE